MAVDFCRVLHCGLPVAMEVTGNGKAKDVFGAKREGRSKTKLWETGEIGIIRRFVIRVYRISVIKSRDMRLLRHETRETNRFSASQKNPHIL